MKSPDQEQDADVRPYGGWPSVIDAAAVARGTTLLSAPGVGPPGSGGDGTIYWLELRPGEGGRTTLMSSDGGGRELTPAPVDVRSRVYEYGGGAYLATALGVVYVDAAEQDVHLISTGGTTSRLTRDGPGRRHADFCIDVAGRRLIMVTEHHGEDEPRHTLEVLDLNEPDAPCRTLHQGRDFYAAPRLSPDGSRLAFLTWDHPNMPWDGTELRLLTLNEAGEPTSETLVAGGAAESVLQPTWSEDTLLFASDATGFWNLHRFDAAGTTCVLEDAAEYASPPWTLGQNSFVPLSDRFVAAIRREDQAQQLVLVDVDQGFATPLDTPWEEFRGLAARGAGLVFIGSRSDEADSLVCLPLDGGPPETLVRAAMPPLPAAWVSRPERLVYPTRDGGRAFAYYYAPVNPGVKPAPGSLPPLVVMTHGGPTSQTSAALNPRIQYFTSRGFAVVDVDYRGSAGYGRGYRHALDGRWGELEVADCEDAVGHLVTRRLVDPRRVAIRGGSAGGFTTLAALTTSAVFGAGASYYGIGDLTALGAQTHKFESRYLDTLVGDDAALRDRSPIRHVDALRCPVIFFQGALDRVVPPDQARDMVAALDDKGLPVAYIEFDGESHGFRRAENVARSLAAEYAFYCAVFGLTPDESLPDVEIRNL